MSKQERKIIEDEITISADNAEQLIDKIYYVCIDFEIDPRDVEISHYEFGLFLTFERLETDAEYENRIELEKMIKVNRRSNKLEKDKKTLSRLAKKFGKKLVDV